MKTLMYKRTLQKRDIRTISFFLPLVMWMVIAIFMKYAPFGNNSFLTNDAIHQYYPFFGQYRERILQRDSLLYSMGGGMGFNFLSLWSYYLTSPLNLLIIFFPVSQLDMAMNLLIILKLSLCGFSFSYYLSNTRGKADWRILPFACAYSLSGFALGYAFNIMWLDCLALFPLIVAGMEALVKNGKWKLYTMTLALSLWCSFYISYMICLFLVIWFLFSGFKSIKEFLKKGMQFAGCSILAAGMACLVLLPAYIGITQTATGERMPDASWMASFADIFAGKEGGIFVFSDPISVINHASYNANLYCGIFTLVLVMLYFFSKQIQTKRKLQMGCLLIFLFASLNSGALNYIWHGFHNQVGIPNRFSFLIIFLLLVMGYEALCRLNDYKVWQLVFSMAFSLFLFGILFYLRKENIKTTMLVSSSILVIGYSCLHIWYVRKEGERRLISGVLLLIMCIEILANGLVGSRYQGGVVTEDFYRSQKDVYAASRSLGREGYRAELSNPTVANEGMAYNLPGLGIFGSMVNARLSTLLGNLGFSGSSNRYSYAGGTPVINTLFGLEHILILSPDANRLDHRYQETEQFGEVTVYENDQVLPIAYLSRREILDWESLNGDYFYNQMELLHLLTGGSYEIFTAQKYELIEANDVEPQILDGEQHYGYLEAAGERDDHLVFQADIKENKDLYLRIRANASKKVQVLVNEKIITYKELKDDFYHVGNVEEGDRVQIKVGITENSETYGKISMSMYGYHQEEMDRAYEDLSEDALRITEFKEGKIKGNVKVTREKDILFTTIPYEKGWSVYVDGEKKEVQTIEDALLYVELTEGDHEVQFIYTPPGFVVGSMISSISILILLAIWLISKRKKTKIG